MHILSRSRSRSVQNAAVHKARELPDLSTGVLQRTVLRTCCAHDVRPPQLVFAKMYDTLEVSKFSCSSGSVSVKYSPKEPENPS